MSRDHSCGSSEVMQGKPGIVSMASMAGHCRRENPAWLAYAASGNVAVCLKTDTDVFLPDFHYCHWRANRKGSMPHSLRVC